MEHTHDTGGITKVVRHGNRLAVLLDLSFLESLHIDEYTLFYVEADGARVILTPTDEEKPKLRSAMCADYVLGQRLCQC